MGGAKLILFVLLAVMTSTARAQCPAGNAIIGGTICVDQSALVMERLKLVGNNTTVEISTSGFNIPQSAMTFSSNVIIDGELTVRSTKQKAIYLPEGGIHLEGSSGNTAGGQMFSKKVQTSTITLVGSAILFENAAGVVVATMTSTRLDIDGVSASTVKNKNSGAGAPTVSDCDSIDEFGTQYVSRTPSRLYLCADNGGGGYEWRYVTISP